MKLIPPVLRSLAGDIVKGEGQQPMFVKAGQYMINVENVTHMQVEDDASVVVYFIGGNMIRLTAEEARAIYASLNTAFTTGSKSNTAFPS